MGPKGYCHLAIIPVRAEPTSKSEMVTQLLFGESYTIGQTEAGFTQISIDYDGYQGFISENQLCPIDLSHWSLGHVRPQSQPFAVYGEGQDQRIIVKGSLVPDADQVFKANIDGQVWLSWARSYLNAPYLWGGRSPLGIDCSGLTQITARFLGLALPRDAKDQANCGNTVELLPLSQAGDLAFFENEEGRIIHTGILSGEGTIVHAHGWVREDLIDHTGILSNGKYSHRLRIIRRFTPEPQ